MKILAVIPARAGSKGIPNKNTRIINSKPLISYCIENALASKYITDIIVSTDSPEIELISNHYGVSVKHRTEALCGDAVTLDEVVYDAAANYNGDYVITLQPTSPTLKVSTLDHAISYAIKHDTDTLISVVNKPHLAWVERDGKIVPDYQERVNRQYMPKRYLETGAFVISKSGVVTEHTRIGKNVDVFEIDEEEAIDIDSFGDLLLAEEVLKKHSTAILVNGNNKIGMGHIYRGLELADLLSHKPDIYYNENITDKIVFGDTTYPLIPYSSEEDLIRKLSEKKYKIVINDILDTTYSYINRIKQIEPCPCVINFEDAGEGSSLADIVVNALYDKQSGGDNAYYGEQYYIAPKKFMLSKPIEIKDEVKNIFVCFGGADPLGYTETVLKIVSEDKYVDYHFIVVLGKLKADVQTLIETYSRKNINIMFDVKNMPEEMAKCDIAITSRGRTCYELAMLGIPTISMAQNEREERHMFAREENGFLYLGRNAEEKNIQNALDFLLTSTKEVRISMQEKMLSHDLKQGRENLKSLFNSLT